MFPRAVRVARIARIDVRIDPTWLVMAILVVWSFLIRFTASGRAGAAALVMAVAATVGFFSSLLAHEFAHALEARHRGLEVHGITLFLFGGVTEMEMGAHGARDDFTVAAVGPWTSLVLAAAFGLITTGVDWYLPALDEVSAITGVLGWLNLGLAVFNLLPGAPLDGGRVLRALLWRLTGDHHRATVLASRAGQALAVGSFAIAVGIVVIRPSALFSGAMLAFVGWFLFRAAGDERSRANLASLLEGHTAADLVDGTRPGLAADVPLSQLDARLAATPDQVVYAVVHSTATGPRIVGAVTVAAIEAVAPFDRALRTPRDVMVAVDDLPAVAPATPLTDVMAHLGTVDTVALTDGGTVVALIDRQRANATLRRLHRQRHARRGTQDVPPPPVPGPSHDRTAGG
jgi:Zn-dependent protease